MKGHGEKRSRKQEQAIAALLTQPTLAEAAQEVGIGEVTLWRWLQRPDFQAAYRQARREALGQTIARLQHTSAEAVSALRTIVSDDEAPPGARVTAARIILESALKGAELEDFEARLVALEAGQR